MLLLPKLYQYTHKGFSDSWHTQLARKRCSLCPARTPCSKGTAPGALHLTRLWATSVVVRRSPNFSQWNYLEESTGNENAATRSQRRKNTCVTSHLMSTQEVETKSSGNNKQANTELLLQPWQNYQCVFSAGLLLLLCHQADN